MHPFFAPLSDREAMLLLTTLTVGGSDQIGLFDHLEPEMAARLNMKAQALLAIEADKRVPFMVKQMKQALSYKGQRGVERVDPSWLLQAMRGESPRTVAAILVTLPPAVVRSLLKRLPAGIRKDLPPKEELKNVPPELMRAVRQMFESSFHAMPTASGKRFGFRDLIHLEPAELFQVTRDAGLVELGQTFAAVGRMALAELCRRLPRKKAEELIMAVRRASRVDAPDLKTAQRFLSRVVVNFDDTEEFLQNAGLWRLAKACTGEGDEFKAAFKQRLPRDSGQLFFDFLLKANELEELEPEQVYRLQDSLVVRVMSLAEAGTIGSRWSQLQPELHDPDFLATLETDEDESSDEPLVDSE